MKLYRFSLFFLFYILQNAFADLGDPCETPNGEFATCVSIYNCKVLLDVVKSRDPNSRDFLSKSQCGFARDPLVCCGSTSGYNTQNDDSDDYLRQPDLSNNNLLPGRDSCGYQKTERIYGGNVTALDEYPWMALLQYRRGDGSLTFSCGGSLISNRYVLTAAHCIVGQILNVVGPLVAVRLGEYDTRTDIDCTVVDGYKDCNTPPQNFQVEDTIAHTSYNTKSKDRRNDIALIRLNRNVVYNDFIKPICLPLPSEQANINDELSVSGWGKTETGYNSPIKLKVSVPIKLFSNCASTYRSAGVTLGDTQICAGGENGKDSCTGDSGGPLMNYSPTNTNQFYVEGIVSFGPDCGRRGFPAVYTKVSRYLDWINRNIR